ncbi:DEAD-box ATP-dependent RNA helicase 38 [Citrus sinensis]|uniref:DEAD-box ATP-dependent RNA helicase 38 n=1 Tax=Citrus sinensis TaxID=2711 RepID=A0ACB8MUY5_CITSI|nr:DEAD-box ATP-dependent RNA helicase 38 [Citrus sinensis]KAH9789417.1 DEAD-box ATP-dependent RNA helicase 38 [Citrus sinensis]
MADATENPAAPATLEPLPSTEPKRSWGDVAEEEEEKEKEERKQQQQQQTANTSEDKSTAELDVEGLTIDESKKVNKFLDEAEDSSIKTVTTGDTPYTSATTFEDLNLSPELLKGLYVEMKFQKPSKIQAISLPMILTPPYRNLIAQARNGSGKTTCFVLGMLSRVDPNLKAPQALCICPTRELAIQNLEVLRKMGKHTGITSECAVPTDSTNYVPISKRPPVTAQVVIGTPGTIKKWMSAKKLGFSRLKILVYDEADHMLDEVLLFSATFNETVKNFVTRIVKDYNQLFVKKEELSLESVKQYKVYCPDELAKVMVIRDRIFELGEKMGQTIIFVRTKNSASALHKALKDFGYEVTTIMGATIQEERDKIVKEFKDGLTQVLISTDVLARGFDQQQVNLIVNYDPPVKHGKHLEPDCEVYLHRIGRAGRFGRKGVVFNLLMDGDDMIIMEKIERYFDIKVTEVRNSDEDFKAALKAAGLL